MSAWREKPVHRLASVTEQLKVALKSGEGDHGRQRIMRAGMTGIATIGARGLMFLISLLSLPLASHYLGKERFGVWLTLLGLINWFAIADLGLSSSLITSLSTARGTGDQRQARTIVTSALLTAAAIVLIILSLFFLLSPYLDWAALLNVSSPDARAETRAAFGVVALCFALRILASTTANIYAAYQEGYRYQFWSALCSLFSLLGLLVGIWMQSGLPILIGFFAGGWLLGDLFSTIYLFGFHRPGLRPAIEFFDRGVARGLLSKGFQLWLAQISTIILFQTDLIVVAWLYGASAVSEYGTMLRLFTIVGVTQAAFITPLWSAYSESLAKQDFGWMRRTLNRSLRLSLYWSVSVSVLIALAAGGLFSVLVTPDIRPDYRLLAPMMATEIINSPARCYAIALNGIGATRSQAIFGPLTGLLNLFLSWYLGKNWGPPGVAWATTISLALYMIVILRVEVKQRMLGLS